MRLRSSISVALAMSLVFGVSACRERKEDPTAAPTAAPAPESPPQPAVVASAPPAPPPLQSVVSAGDTTVAGQLVAGFYEQQENWRWTAPAFSVKLAAPVGAAEKGALLRMLLTLPGPVLQQHPTLELKVKVGAQETTKKLSGQGDHTIEIPLEPGAVGGDAVVVECSIDKPFIPGGADTRTLGVIAKSFELATKGAAPAPSAKGPE